MSLRKAAYLIILLLLGGTSIVLSRENERLRSVVSDLRDEVKVKSTQPLGCLTADIPIQTAPASFSPTPSTVATVSEPAESEEKKGDRIEWRANYQAHQISKYIALTSNEEREISRRLAAGEDLSAVLGTEKMERYQSARKAAIDAANEQEIQNEVYLLSGKLRLNEEQAHELEMALREGREKLKLNYEKLRVQSEKAMALHTEPSGDGSELRGIYDEMQKLSTATEARKSKMLQQRLVGVLTDEQMNALLSEPLLSEQ